MGFLYLGDGDFIPACLSVDIQIKGTPVGALLGYILLQVGGIIFNTLWVEAGLRFTGLYPWVIAATYFAIWPFLSFTAPATLYLQMRYLDFRQATAIAK
ncbi:hypothetical protein [Litorimonas sp. RW-G-Af-16]|uniref:hypothetical protein n=1 Tax=Litorimonas sp. RW-G-Af-16 TaxID=3241168 RepID=UPI003AAC979D